LPCRAPQTGYIRFCLGQSATATDGKMIENDTTRQPIVHSLPSRTITSDGRAEQMTAAQLLQIDISHALCSPSIKTNYLLICILAVGFLRGDDVIESTHPP
jgi:hypothetical protein